MWRLLEGGNNWTVVLTPGVALVGGNAVFKPI